MRLKTPSPIVHPLYIYQLICRETFMGPFDYFIGFAQYLVPLLVLELYFRATERRELAGQISVAIIVAVTTVVTGIGTFSAAPGMWLPGI